VTVARDVDVLVAGAGIAGVSVAAALSGAGYEVVLVEPGLDETKRLAGELVHPPGVADLAELGLLAPLEKAGALPVRGFAVYPDRDQPPAILPYGEIAGLAREGFAIDHVALSDGLRRAAELLPRVRLWLGARVVDLDVDRGGRAEALVAGPAGTVRVRARLVVGADGSASSLRRLAGIGHDRVRVSHMVGYLVHGAAVPCAGYGNVFLGGPAPVLAYAVAPDAVRVMFDVPDNPRGLDAPATDGEYLDALPASFRAAVAAAMRMAPRLVSANYTLTAHAVVRGRLALVGDAAGCCHPLTATGLSACTRDAVRLRQALADTGGDVPAALPRYARLRGGPQKTRMALAEALYAAFAGSSPEMRLLRRALLRYWSRSRRGRAASLALLSTHEGRMSRMALQYARVAGQALASLVARRPGPEAFSLAARQRAMVRLSRTTLQYLREALTAR
jgi:2-polyprenyl-6-methoxyphenol hydroxylase-like FAD-dependent oxidoreductase